MTNELNSKCVTVSWFPSTDFQLWLLSFIPLVFLRNNAKLAVCIIVGFIVTGSVSTALITWYFDYPALLHGSTLFYLLTSNYSDSYGSLELWTCHWMSSYFLGYLLAYYMSTTKESSKLVALMKAYAIWNVIVVVFMFPTVYDLVIGNGDNYWLAIAYSTVLRLPFALVYLLMFYVCHNDLSKLINASHS